MTTNWNPDVHESRIFEWKSWSHRAIHTDTLGTTSNLTNTDGRQIFEVADPNDSSYCRLGCSTCFLDSDPILAACRRENFIRTTMATTIRISIVHLCRNCYVMLNRRRSYRNTPCDSTQASRLDDARFRMRIWLLDGGKLFRTRTVRRFPEGPERWNHETMQRFAVKVANPDFNSRRSVEEARCV